jgi:hypothetical protein
VISARRGDGQYSCVARIREEGSGECSGFILNVTVGLFGRQIDPLS